MSGIAGQLLNSSMFFALIFFGTFITFYALKYLIFARLVSFSKKTAFKYDDVLAYVLNSFGFFFFLYTALFFTTRFIDFGDFTRYINAFFILVFSFYIVRTINVFVTAFGDSYIKKQQQQGEEVDKGVISVMALFIKGLLWGVAVLILLQNLGVNVSALIAALGVGGIAVGFALQSVLADLFAYFSIFFDKPFKVGDFITFGESSGTVEYIGIKTTRLRTLQGQQLVVPNTALTESEVNNYEKLSERRVVLKIGVTYSTSTKMVKDIPNILENCSKGIELVRFDRAHFVEFDDSSLNFELVFFVNSEDYAVYLNKLQQVNLNILKEFRKQKIEFAYPTQTIVIEKS
jgi:small-conductance mechanosensitive channel